MPRTLAELAREVIQVQDACNLSGVAQSFAKAISELRELLNLGTDATNRHPICILWADKIAHLTGTQALGNDVVMKAYGEVYMMILR